MYGPFRQQGLIINFYIFHRECQELALPASIYRVMAFLNRKILETVIGELWQIYANFMREMKEEFAVLDIEI